VEVAVGLICVVVGALLCWRLAWGTEAAESNLYEGPEPSFTDLAQELWVWVKVRLRRGEE
jgi:hypothetical protein